MLARTVVQRDGFDSAVSLIDELGLGEEDPVGQRDLIVGAIVSEGFYYKPVDLEKRAEWMLANTSDTGRATVLKPFVESWLRHDRTAAEAWVRSLPAGADRTTAIETIIKRLEPIYPAAARDSQAELR